MTYVLILVLWGSGNSSSPALLHAEFSTKDKCEAAAQAYRDAIGSTGWGISWNKAFCVEK